MWWRAGRPVRAHHREAAPASPWQHHHHRGPPRTAGAVAPLLLALVLAAAVVGQAQGQTSNFEAGRPGSDGVWLSMEPTGGPDVPPMGSADWASAAAAHRGTRGLAVTVADVMSPSPRHVALRVSRRKSAPRSRQPRMECALRSLAGMQARMCVCVCAGGRTHAEHVPRAHTCACRHAQIPLPSMAVSTTQPLLLPGANAVPQGEARAWQPSSTCAHNSLHHAHPLPSPACLLPHRKLAHPAIRAWVTLGRPHRMWRCLIARPVCAAGVE